MYRVSQKGVPEKSGRLSLQGAVSAAVAIQRTGRSATVQRVNEQDEPVGEPIQFVGVRFPGKSS